MERKYEDVFFIKIFIESDEYQQYLNDVTKYWNEK